MSGIRHVYLMANDIDRLGGVSRFVNTLGVGLHERGYGVTLIGVAPTHERVVYERPEDIEAIVLMDEALPRDWKLRGRRDRFNIARRNRHRKRSALRAAAVGKLRSLLATMDETCAIVCTQVYGMEHLIEAGWRPTPGGGPVVIGQYHGSYLMAVEINDLNRVLRSYAQVDRFACLTAADAEDFRRAGLNNVTWIPNPVFLGPLPDVPRRDEIVSLARYDTEKSLDLLVRAWAAIAGRYPAWRLRLYGEGDQRSLLERIIAAERVPRVSLEGRVSDVRPALASARIHALSSQHEGLPISIVEAATAGVPTVAFDCSPGIGQLIEHEVSGLIVPRNDVAGLSRGLARLIEDPVLLQALSRNARMGAESYAVPRIVARWEELFADATR